jgi:hypothetical protein
MWGVKGEVGSRINMAFVSQDRRREVLARLGLMFARMDDAIGRGDLPTAQLMIGEVQALLREAQSSVLQAGSRDDPMRSSGIQTKEKKRDAG